MIKDRMRMRLTLTEQELEERWPCRTISREDIPALARLMLDAFRGTIDDDGETLEDALTEVQNAFARPLIEPCSLVIEEPGRALSCVMLSCWQERPLVAYVFTHPLAKNQGMGRFLIRKSINALLAQGYRELDLGVTKGNHPAQHLYESLGFQVVSEFGAAEVNGVRLYYEVGGKGHPLVLLHSGLANSRMWDQQFEALARQYRVIRYDFRGYGLSEMSPGPFSHREDLYQLLRSLHVEQAYLLGSSMGGEVAVDFTLEHPEMVAALIPVSAGVSGEQPSEWLLKRWEEIGAVAEAGDVARAVEFELRLWVDGPGRTPDQVAPAVREQVHAMNVQNFARAPEQEQGLEEPLEPPAIGRLGEIRVPTLVIVGDQDVPDKLAAADLLAQGISGARKVVIPGTAHLPSMEQPEAFNRLVVQFLGGLR